ncbi:hypothetical protein HT031_005289 [Scenedesmus sp. PABB004]|nr:hypothetical protein HT031_005289 [Scenedesmus sp. PABB004]
MAPTTRALAALLLASMLAAAASAAPLTCSSAKALGGGGCDALCSCVSKSPEYANSGRALSECTDPCAACAAATASCPADDSLPEACAKYAGDAAVQTCMAAAPARRRAGVWPAPRRRALGLALLAALAGGRGAAGQQPMPFIVRRRRAPRAARCPLLALPLAGTARRRRRRRSRAAAVRARVQGNGDVPPSVPVDVYVTAFLDRLLKVDDNAYEFQPRRRPRGGAAGGAARALLALALLLAGGLARRAGAQQPQPFQGQGDAAPAVPTDVYVSAFVDRLLAVDDRAYAFQVVWFYLSWRDPRARAQLEENAAKLTAPNSTYECASPCQSNNKPIAGGCCDGVWMPYIAFSNLKWLPQDRVVRFGFGTMPDSDGVFQWRSVHATYFTPMDLRAFPFDTQHLLIQMEVPQARSGWSGGLVNLLPSTTGSSLFTAKTSGDDVSGWGVNSVRLTPFTYPLCQATMAGALGPSAPGEPLPVVPQYMWDSQARAKPSQCAAVLSSDPARGARSPFWRSSMSKASNVPSMPVPVSGLNCVIVVSRFTTRWVLSAIFPIMATTWLGFLVFFLPRDDMNGRAGSIVALFLALAAIQFVVDSDVPSSSYIMPLQQLTLASYLSLILVGAECVAIWWVTTYHAEAMRQRRHRAAAASYSAKLAAVRAALESWLAKAHPRRAGLGFGISPASPTKRSSGSGGGGSRGRSRLAAGGGGGMQRPDGLRGSSSDDGAGASGRGSAAGAGGSGGGACGSPRAPPLVASSPTEAEGEVRLLVAPPPSPPPGCAPPAADAAAAPEAAPLAAAAPPEEEHVAPPPPPPVVLASKESLELADAAAAAALAAEELAATEAGEAPHPVAHRVGVLRFMRAPGSGAGSDPGAAGGGGATWRSASAGASRGGSGAGDAHGGAPQLAGAGSLTQLAGSASMTQVVADLLSAQGKELPRVSTAPAGGGAAPGKAGAAASARPSDVGAGEAPLPRSRLLRQLHIYLDSVWSDDAFADRAAHLANKWCGIVQFVAYNVAATLIFVVNAALNAAAPPAQLTLSGHERLEALLDGVKGVVAHGLGRGAKLARLLTCERLWLLLPGGPVLLPMQQSATLADLFPAAPYHELLAEVSSAVRKGLTPSAAAPRAPEAAPLLSPAAGSVAGVLTPVAISSQAAAAAAGLPAAALPAPGGRRKARRRARRCEGSSDDEAPGLGLQDQPGADRKRQREGSNDVVPQDGADTGLPQAPEAASPGGERRLKKQRKRLAQAGQDEGPEPQEPAAAQDAEPPPASPQQLTKAQRRRLAASQQAQDEAAAVGEQPPAAQPGAAAAGGHEDEPAGQQQGQLSKKQRRALERELGASQQQPDEAAVGMEPPAAQQPAADAPPSEQPEQQLTRRQRAQQAASQAAEADELVPAQQVEEADAREAMAAADELVRQLTQATSSGTTSGTAGDGATPASNAAPPEAAAERAAAALAGQGAMANLLAAAAADGDEAPPLERALEPELGAAVGTPAGSDAAAAAGTAQQASEEQPASAGGSPGGIRGSGSGRDGSGGSKSVRSSDDSSSSSSSSSDSNSSGRTSSSSDDDASSSPHSGSGGGDAADGAADSAAAAADATSPSGADDAAAGDAAAAQEGGADATPAAEGGDGAAGRGSQKSSSGDDTTDSSSDDDSSSSSRSSSSSDDSSEGGGGSGGAGSAGGRSGGGAEDGAASGGSGSDASGSDASGGDGSSSDGSGSDGSSGADSDANASDSEPGSGSGGGDEPPSSPKDLHTLLGSLWQARKDEWTAKSGLRPGRAVSGGRRDDDDDDDEAEAEAGGEAETGAGADAGAGAEERGAGGDGREARKAGGGFGPLGLSREDDAAINGALAELVVPLDVLRGRRQIGTFRKAVREMVARAVNMRSTRPGGVRVLRYTPDTRPAWLAPELEWGPALFAKAGEAQLEALHAAAAGEMYEVKAEALARGEAL